MGAEQPGMMQGSHTSAGQLHPNAEMTEGDPIVLHVQLAEGKTT